MSVSSFHLVAADDENWDEARRGWNLAIDQRPVGVAFPESTDDVAAAVRHAAERRLRIAFQGGGHNTGPIPWGDDVFLLRTDRMRDIAVDAVGRRARIGAGVLSDELTAAAAAHGLAFLVGTSPDVGVVGYSLGGGLSWFARKHGLCANSILAADVVTADGRLVRTHACEEPDLFWALRGGGGNFAAVTALELQLFPIAEVFGGALFWPVDRAAEVLDAWRVWIDAVPEECTSLARLLELPPLPVVPENLRGRSFALVELVSLDGDDELVAALRALEPEIDTVGRMPVTGLSAINMDPPEPMPYYGEGVHLEAFDRDAIDAVVRAFDGSSLMHFEVRHLGGALARSSASHGALDAIESPFTTFAFGLAPDAGAFAAVSRDVEALNRALHPWYGGRRYLNLTESACDVRAFFPPRSYDRLRELKRLYDPDCLFCANHHIEP
jgi:FAD/FMN-containing dehydrogenase